MRWEPLEVKGSQGRAWIKTLSKDEETGGRTALIKFDPGFRQAKATSEWPVDMYVLEGEMRCGALRFERDTFHYRPAGVEYGPIECPQGITRLVFTADSKNIKSSREPVFIQDVKQMPQGIHPLDLEGTRGIWEKILRQDPEGGISLMVHEVWEVGRQGLPKIQHAHNHFEEAFVIRGEGDDYLGEVDGHVHYVAGAYLCRPPNESFHGDTLARVVPKTLVLRHSGRQVRNAEEYARGMESHSPGRPVTPLSFIE
jgi:hypothetical protein